MKALPLTIDEPKYEVALDLAALAIQHQLTPYDAAYLEMAIRLKLPVAMKDNALKRVMASAGVALVEF